MSGFQKLKETDIETIIDSGKNIEDYLADNVANYLIVEKCEMSAEFEYCLADCESPIEQLLAISLTRLFRQKEIDIPILVDVIAIEKQQIIVCNDRTYRVDFLIPVMYWNCNKTFIIECDGHSFHQKTKEQVERDNQRTRDLQSAGYTVIRFSGTEIYHRPYRCALEVKKIIQAPALKFIEGAVNNETEKNNR